MKTGNMAFNIYVWSEISFHYEFSFFIPSDKKMKNTEPDYCVGSSYS